MKEAADLLMKRALLNVDTFTRIPEKGEIPVPTEEGTIEIGMYELIHAFNNVLENMGHDHHVALESEEMSIKDRMMELIDLLEHKHSLVFDDLFDGARRKRDIIVTFLAILEMAKLNLIKIIQHIQSGVIRLHYV